jgi:TATA-binding protein-associated factor
VPSLWQGLTAALSEQQPGADSEAQHAQLQVLGVVVSCASEALQPQLLQLLPGVTRCLASDHDALRARATACVAAFLQTCGAPALYVVQEHVIALARDATREYARLGAAEAVAALMALERAALATLLPNLVFFVLPLLALVSDPSVRVRKAASAAFAAAVRLLPLEQQTPSPPHMPPEMAARRQRERAFVEQLLDGRRVAEFAIPVRISVPLRRYQQEGVNWLAFLRRFGLHGALCDDMGLGKTLQTICIVASEHFERAAQRPGEPRLPSLVVCPSSLLLHWCDEVRKFVEPSVLTAVPLIGDAARRRAVLAESTRGSRDVLVVMAYSTLRRCADELQGTAFNYCVLDEGHVIKNARSRLAAAVKRVVSQHRIILTGTPIQNEVTELWSLFDFLMPGFLGSTEQFAANYSRPISQAAARALKNIGRTAARGVRDDSTAPAAEAEDGDAVEAAAHEAEASGRGGVSVGEAGVRALEALHRQVLPFILRRVKEDVAADLPPKLIQDVYCNMTPLQARLYAELERSGVLALPATVVEGGEAAAPAAAAAATAAATATTTAAKGSLQAIQYMRRLCTHPALVLPPARARELVEGGAAALSESLAASPKLVSLRDLLLQCGIGLADARREVEGGDEERGAAMDDDEDEEEEEAAALGAREKGAAAHRALVFAQSKATLDLIERVVLRRHLPSVTFERVDGDVKPDARFATVKRFNEDPTIDLLLLTTHVGGLGLNLTGADTVIFVENDWNPVKDLQAMDRAHRIGQTRTVNVYRLITRDTLEERILNLQEFKRLVAATVVTKDNKALASMNRGQVLDLMTGAVAVAPGPAAGASSSSSAPAAEGVVGVTGEVSTSAVEVRKTSSFRQWLDSLELVAGEEEEKEFDLTAFTKSLSKPR